MIERPLRSLACQICRLRTRQNRYHPWPVESRRCPIFRIIKSTLLFTGRRLNSKIKPKLRHSLLLIGPKTGETVMGVSVAFDLLSDYLKEIGGKTKEVNLTQSGAASTAGRFRWGRMGFTVARVVESWFKMLTVSSVYLIVFTSVLGFIKDFLVILVA